MKRSTSKGRSNSPKVKSRANSSFSILNHVTATHADPRGKLDTETTASATSAPRNRAASGSAPRPLIYGNIDHDNTCNEAGSVIWDQGTSSTAIGSHAGDDASLFKLDVASASSAKAMPPPSGLVRYVKNHRVGDAQPVLVRGCKYVFDTRSMRWLTHPVTIRVLHHNRGADQDNYFATFIVELLDPVKSAAPMFAKVYRHNIEDVAEADYFSLGQAQTLCEEFAREYVRTDARGRYTKFPLPLLTNRVVVRLDMHSILDPEIRNSRKGFFSYRTMDTRQMMFMMEPNTLACEAVGASFASPQVDEGRIYGRGDPAWSRDIYQDIADGFSHFTYIKSRERMVAHGFLRSNGYLLDPLFHTTDREGFRMGDGGKKAMVEWMERHRCGDTCRALGVASFDDNGKPIKKAAVFVNPLDAQENHYTDFLRSVRQMRVVVRIDMAHSPCEDEEEEERETVYDAVSDSSDRTSTTHGTQLVPVSPVSFKVTCDAVKYVFLPSGAKWEELPMRLTVCAPTSPDTVDDKYAFFSVEEEREGGQPVPMRARFILRPDARDADYYHIGDAYCVCVALGQVFRGYRKNGVFERELDFYSAYAVRVPQSRIPDSVKAHMRGSNFFARTTADSGDVMFVVEPEFRSNAPLTAAKRDADGFDDPVLRQVVDAFSHFTLHKSGNHLLVCRFKCSHGLLMRPEIHTSNGCGFETINGGQEEIDRWVASHQCNDLCRLIGMDPLPRRLKLYNISTSRLMRYINQVQQHTKATDEKIEFASPVRRREDLLALAAASQPASPAAPASPTASTAFGTHLQPPRSTAEEAMLRPWTAEGRRMSAGASRKAAAARRSLTAQEIQRLEAKGIDVKYIFPATRYNLNIEDLTWTSQRIFVRVINPERGIGQGGMRVCFEIATVDPEFAEESVLVAKMYRRTIKDVVEHDYFTSVTVQRLSGLFASDFNQEKKAECCVPLNVLDAAVIAIDRADLSPDLLAKRTGFFSYRTQDSQRVMFCVEAKLAGRFTKYNGNMGEAYPTNESRLNPAAARERTMVFEAVEALSHYSLEKSEGGLLVCDMQGVKSDLTDLEMHTYDGQGLGVGNFGARGILRFAQRHRCTSVCKSLNLENLRDKRFDLSADRLAKNKYVSIFERSKAIDKLE
ncbi:hypothetical protein NESM_000109400 [Novymonas esmeraldas]|uniref:Alpha-type protein kinase domain-containing protein n=1 Tax=Novymonas esmeraldas TaxID=1808958 RepID=A0AAW0F5U9_9TRYP